MLILFAISVVCFLALIGVGIAIARHIRSGREAQPVEAPPPPSFAEHMHAASEYGSVRTPRQIRHQTVEAITANKAWNQPSQSVEIHPAADEEEFLASRRKAPQRVAANDRADWTHFNKDYGDLTDPHPSRPMRAAASGKTISRRY